MRPAERKCRDMTVKTKYSGPIEVAGVSSEARPAACRADVLNEAAVVPQEYVRGIQDGAADGCEYWWAESTSGAAMVEFSDSPAYRAGYCQAWRAMATEASGPV